MYQFILDISPGLVPLLAAFAAYLLGLRAYHLQREYELVRRRYLDEGLDAFAADVEHALSLFKNNWQHAITVLKYYREMDTSMRKELLDEGYLDLDMSRFRVRPNYRVGKLVGDQAFWQVQQMLFAFVGHTASFFKDDLGGAVRHAIGGKPLHGSKDQMIRAYFDECEKYLREANRYHVLLSEVQHLITEFEKRRFTLRGVHKFKERPEVKLILSRLKSAFADKFQKYEGAQERPLEKSVPDSDGVQNRLGEH